jgi:hypothetical protein
MPSTTLWVRAGDSDNYNAFDGFQEVADYLAEMGATDRLERCNEYGVTSPEYRGNNYISLFWGDDDAQPSRPLTIGEHDEINRLLHSIRPACVLVNHRQKDK